MSQHPLLTNLRAVLENPCESTLDKFKAKGWFTPLWMVGQTQEFPDGQVAIAFSASEIEGADRPVLFTYVDEAEARKDNPDEQFISYSMGVVGLLAHQREVDLAVVDGEDDVVLSHEHLLILRDFMQFEADPETRNKASDDLFLAKFETFLQQAQDYCRRMPDVQSLYLVAVEPGGAPMRAGVFLEAKKPSVHQKALQALFEKQMLPGDCMSFFDPHDLAERKMIEKIKQLEPAYLRQPPQGWWARLFSRNKEVQIVILKLEIAEENA